MAKKEEQEEAISPTRSILFNKYEMGRLLGQGTFAKVYYARDILSNNSPVAIKIISKDQTRRHKALIHQIETEISIMRLVRHPNIVHLKEVLATKTKIFFVMEYVRGGNLKVSDFGLSALPEQLRQDGLLHTQCGTPAYVAPEVLRKKGYDGAKADVWSCGVILFALLAGFLPFQDENLMKMYTKVFKAEYQIPPWFSPDAKRLVKRLLVADPNKRISIAEIMEVPWFKKGFVHLHHITFSTPDMEDSSKLIEEELDSPRFYNAFELISTMSSGFDLSNLFESKQKKKKGTVFTSRRPVEAIMEALETTGRGLGFGVRKAKSCKVRLEGKSEGRKGKLDVTAEVFEVAPEVAVVEFCKNSGDTLEYVKFCEQDVRPGLKDIVWTWQGEDQGVE